MPVINNQPALPELICTDLLQNAYMYIYIYVFVYFLLIKFLFYILFYFCTSIIYNKNFN